MNGTVKLTFIILEDGSDKTVFIQLLGMDK